MNVRWWGRLRQRLKGSRAPYYLIVALFLLAPAGLAAYDGQEPPTSCIQECSDDCERNRSCGKSRYLGAPGDASAPLAVDASADGTYAYVWLEFGVTGVFTPTQPARGVTLASADGETPPIPDELAEKGYLAIRVPHAPPAYSLSSLLPGIPPDEVEPMLFSYYAPPNSATLPEVQVPLVRRTEYEAAVNARYPISDGRSHWEVWWLPEGEGVPMPNQPFRLKSGDSPPPLRVRFRVDFGDADAAACSNCQAQALLYNGYVFIGPYDIAVRYTQLDVEGPLVTFGDFCGDMRDDLSSTMGRVIEPGQRLTYTVCLENWDTTARTFHITASSSQGWDYTFYTQTATLNSKPVAAPAAPFAVTVGPPATSWAPGLLAILAVYTPTTDVDTTLRETFEITATSVISPEVWAHTTVFAFGEDYQLAEDGEGEGVFLPLIVRREP